MTKTIRFLLSYTALIPLVVLIVVTTHIETARVATTNLNIETQVIHSFNRGNHSDGGEPSAGLVQGSDMSGYLYGTTSRGGANDGGTIFRIAPNGSGFTLLHSFNGTDGYIPLGKLVRGGDVLSFYGTANYGGLYGQGTVFKFTLDTSRNLKKFKTLHSFSTTGEQPNGLVRGNDGYFYGTTVNTLYRITADGAFQTLYNHSDTTVPLNAHNDIGIYLKKLVKGQDGRLYGVAFGGGPAVNRQANGTLYAIPPTQPGQNPNWNPDILYSFHCPTDAIHGCDPVGGVVQDAQGNLYGTTSKGGQFDHGTIFKYTLNTRTLYNLHNFSASDGDPTDTRLLLASDGKLYGTTTANSGTVYRISTNGTDNFQVIHTKIASTDPGPSNELIQGRDGSLYGTSNSGGGPYNAGTVYKIDGRTLGLNRF